MESILRTEVDTSRLEIRIERFLRFSVIAIKTMQLVIVYLERWKVTLWIDNLLFPFLNRIIQKSVADKVDESVLIGLFKSLLQTRLTSLSLSMPAV